MTWLQAIYTLAEEDEIDQVELVFTLCCPNGFVVEDPQAMLEHIENHDWDAHSYDEINLHNEKTRCIAYFDVDDKESAHDLAQHLRAAGLQGKFQLVEKPAKNWYEEWKANVDVLRIGERFQLVPEWRTPEHPIDLVIRLEPGIGFGSGEHETTAMSLTFLETYVQPGMRVIDVGCGSGILAIAARLLGAADVLALDNDEQAVHAARQNVARNEVAVAVYRSDLLAEVTEAADIIVANIITDAVLVLLPDLKAHLRSGGKAILSGIHLARLPEVMTLANNCGFSVIQKKEGDEWATVVVQADEEEL